MNIKGNPKINKITSSNGQMEIDVDKAKQSKNGSNDYTPLITNLNDVKNVNAVNPSGGQSLVFSNATSSWVPSSVSSGATSLNELSDVTLTNSKQLEFMQYLNGQWVNTLITTGGSGATSLNELSDVTLTNSKQLEFLQYKGGVWVNTLITTGGSGGASDLNGLTDVTLTAVEENQFLQYKGGVWANTLISTGGSGGASDLNGLTDVIISTPQQLEFLQYKGGVWVNTLISTGGSGATSLNELTDVIISTPQQLEFLQYKGGQWVNTPITTGGGISDLNGLTDVTLTAVEENQFLQYKGGVWVNTLISTGGGGTNALNDLSDVNAGSPTDGQSLTWDNGTSKWVPETISASGGGGGASDLNGLSDVVLTSVQAGDILRYNDSTSKWENIDAANAAPSSKGEKATPIFPTITGIQVHYDADGDDNFTLVGNDVDVWLDGSGNANNIPSVSVASRPERKTNIVNGRSGVYFDATSQLKTNLVGPNAAWTYFIVCDNEDVSSNLRACMGGQVNGQASIYESTTTPANTTMNIDWGGTARIVGTGIAWNTPIVITLIPKNGSTQAEVRINGIEVYKSTHSGISNATALCIGCLGGLGAGNNWLGHIFEFLAYDTVLGSTDVGTVETYLINKWTV